MKPFHIKLLAGLIAIVLVLAAYLHLLNVVPDEAVLNENEMLIVGILLIIFGGISIYGAAGKTLLKQQRRSRWSWLFLISFLLLLKGIEKLHFPVLWAEDGPIFMHDAYALQTWSLFKPYAGYFHTLPRILALISSWLPVIWVPYFINLACVFIYSIVATKVFTKGYDWLSRKNNHIIILLPILWCLTPGLSNTLGNLANLHWFLLAYLFLLCFKDLKHSFSTSEVLFALICIASEGAAFMIIPILLFRLFIQWKSERSIKKFRNEGILLFFTLAFFILTITVKDQKSAMFFPQDAILVWVKHFSTHLIIHPLLGDEYSLMIGQNLLLCASVVMIAFLFMLVLRKKVKDRMTRYTLVVFLWVSFFPIVLAIARVKSIPMLLTFFDYNPSWFTFRYAFVLPFFGILFWMFIHQQFKFKLLRVAVPVLMLIASTGLNRHRIFMHTKTFQLNWNKHAEEITKVLNNQQESVQFEIEPNGWHFELHAASLRKNQ